MVNVDAELARALLEGADWLRKSAAVASEHSTEKYTNIWMAPHQARVIAKVMEAAAVHIGKEIK